MYIVTRSGNHYVSPYNIRTEDRMHAREAIDVAIIRLALHELDSSIYNVITLHIYTLLINFTCMLQLWSRSNIAAVIRLISPDAITYLERTKNSINIKWHADNKCIKRNYQRRFKWRSLNEKVQKRKFYNIMCSQSPSLVTSVRKKTLLSTTLFTPLCLLSFQPY